MSTAGERVRAIRIVVPSRIATPEVPLSAHDRAMLSMVARGVLQHNGTKWINPKSAHQPVSNPSLNRLAQRGYIVLGRTANKPSVKATAVGRGALGLA